MSFFFTNKRADQKQKNETNILWTEKYRPKKLDDISHQSEVINTFKMWIDNDRIPHMLFYGPPGSGKTSTILAICKQLYSPSVFKQRVLELNASDERGINIVRKKIKNFARYSAKPLQDDVYPNPSYKIIILDEADNMTADAQTALRRTMEDYSKVTRFCLICNYVSKIIEPIVSRCAVFRFKPIDKSILTDKLKLIADKEDIKLTSDGIEKISHISNGDLRKGITFMQSLSDFYKDETIDENKVDQISGFIPDDVIATLLTQKDFDKLRNQLMEYLKDGYDAKQMLRKTMVYILNDNEIEDKQKSKMLIKIGEAENKLLDGADEFLQLISVLSFISK